MDKDGDGSVSSKEFQEGIDKLLHGGVSKEEFMKSVDKDGDGVISPEEQREALKASGAISADASPEEIEQILKGMDKDGDGIVSPEELQSGIAKSVPISISEFKRRVNKKYSTPQQAFDAFDTDKDGKLSLEELVQAGSGLDPPVKPEDVAELFKNIDKNG